MTSATSSVAPTGATASAGTDVKQPKNLTSDPLAQKEAFLRLLVAQIKNQDPMNPADGIEFLSQLAQFSQLEQMLNIRSELETIRKNLTPPSAKDAAAAGPDSSKGG